MVAISDVRREQLVGRLEHLLQQETPGTDTPLQSAIDGLVSAVYETQLTGRALEQVVQSKRLALGGVLQTMGFSAQDAQDLTKILANQGEQGQGSGGPRPRVR